MTFVGLIINGPQRVTLALTPLERWQAARTFDQGLLTNHWFVLACVVVMVALAVLLFWVSLHRVRQELRNSDRVSIELGREKIGFGKAYAALQATQSRSRSSKDISVAKQVTLRRMPASETQAIEAMVHSNTDHELCVQLDEAVKVTLGELWVVRYFHGASVWEFDTSVISYDGTVMALTHSDQVRFVNRRRFLRAPVLRRALIAKFPFEQTLKWADNTMTVNRNQEEIGQVHPIEALGAPEFVPATVTEMGGPGLRIETSLDIRVGERVLVVFDMDVGPLGSDDHSYRDRRSRLIEDIGEVRHVKRLDTGVSVAVELSGLKDAEINELIRATNAALVEINARQKTVHESRSQAMTQAVAV